MNTSAVSVNHFSGKFADFRTSSQSHRQKSALRFAGYRETHRVEPLRDGSGYVRVTTVTGDQGVSFRLRQFFSSASDAQNPPSRKGPIVLFLPGLANQSGGDDPFFEHQVDGFSVYSLCRSYVPTSGKVEFSRDQVLNTTAEAMRWLSQKHGQPISVVGFSLGGLTALHVAAQKSSQLQRLCLISPTLLSDTSLKQALVQLPFRMKISEAAIQQLREFCRGWEGLFQAINVPILVQAGEDELSTDQELFLRSLLKQDFLPDTQKRLEIFPNEDHEVSKARLEQLRQLWLMA
jgi:dienelactone hydrolase